MKPHDNLEEFTDPPNYDIEEGARSAKRIAFYCELAKSIGACGSGLVTIPSAVTGLDVTGVDLARPMLEHVAKKAEAQNPKIRWMEANAFDLGLKYAFIYLTGNAFQAFLQREDQEALLASSPSRRATHPGMLSEQYGDWDHEKLSAASPSIISICRPQ